MCQNGWREGVGMTRMYIKKVNGIKFWFLVDFNLLKWKRMTDGLTLQKSAQKTSLRQQALEQGKSISWFLWTTHNPGIRTVHCSEKFLHWSLNMSLLATFSKTACAGLLCSEDFLLSSKRTFRSASWSDSGSHFIYFVWKLWKAILMTKAKLNLHSVRCYLVAAMAICRKSLLLFSHS